MKTFCPHCNQEYDIDSSFLNQEVNCGVCKQNFIAGQAKFCIDCGTICPAEALTCRKCGKQFLMPQTVNSARPQTMTPVNMPRVSSAEELSRIQKRGIDLLIFTLYLPLFVAIFTCVIRPMMWGDKVEMANLLILIPAGIIYLVVIFPALSLLLRVTNPQSKIVLTTIGKGSMILATVIWVFMFIFLVVDSITSPSGVQFVLLFMSLLGLLAVPSTWRLIRTRAEEDMDWEPDEGSSEEQ